MPSAQVVVLMGQTAEEVADVASKKADPLVKPFSALERDEKARIRRPPLETKHTVP